MKRRDFRHPKHSLRAAAVAFTAVLLAASSAMATIIYDLGTLGETNSWGGGVNGTRQMAGSSQITANIAQHAFRYDGTPGSGGVMRDLGTLGGSNSYGVGINDAGQVVGFSQIAGNAANHAFLYTGTPGVDGRMFDLDAWLDANDPTEGAKWTLTGASASNTGWITGTGTYDPDGPGGVDAATRAYLLDASSLVPEPSAPALLSLGGLAFLRRRRNLSRASAIPLHRQRHRPLCPY